MKNDFLPFCAAALQDSLVLERGEGKPHALLCVSVYVSCFELLPDNLLSS